MPQFTLTQEEHVMVVDALRSKATQYTTMFGVADPALEAMLAKINGQQPADLVEPTEEEIEAHAAAEEPTATDETSVAE
jgi:hypothetical protein